ncbi:MAG: hypothetical protein ACRC0G_16040 [Fusobacteriaceae bacterium]
MKNTIELIKKGMYKTEIFRSGTKIGSINYAVGETDYNIELDDAYMQTVVDAEIQGLKQLLANYIEGTSKPAIASYTESLKNEFVVLSNQKIEELNISIENILGAAYKGVFQNDKEYDDGDVYYRIVSGVKKFKILVGEEKEFQLLGYKKIGITKIKTGITGDPKMKIIHY